jgi:hypothetical protein
MLRWAALFLFLFIGLAAPLQAQVTGPNAAWQRLTCALPWGGTLNTGSSTTAYQASSVTCGNSCVSQSRTCTGNALSGSYQYSSCNVGSCASCSLPWGGSITHGQSVTAYAGSLVPCGSSCSSQTRTCNNGSLSGSHQYSSCSVASCPTWHDGEGSIFWGICPGGVGPGVSCSYPGPGYYCVQYDSASGICWSGYCACY